MCHLSRTNTCSDLFRAHVFADLAPYMCIYPGCDTGEQCYATTEQWIRHQNLHRTPTDRISLPTVCPFCDKSSTDKKRYMHVLSHMERIRLLALPPSGLISGDNDDLAYFDSSDSGVSGDSTSQSAPGAGSSEFVDRLKDMTLTQYDYITNRWLPDEEGGTPQKSVCTTTQKQGMFMLSLITVTHP